MKDEEREITQKCSKCQNFLEKNEEGELICPIHDKDWKLDTEKYPEVKDD